MTQEEIQNLKRIVIVTAAYYGHLMSDDVMKMHVADLHDLPYEATRLAYQAFRKDPRNKRAPLPAEIRAIVLPTENEADRARELAVRLVSAVGRYGQYWFLGYRMGGGRNFDGAGCQWPTWEEAVEAEVGPLGAAVIERFGGWAAFYDHCNTAEPTTLHAQLRDLLGSVDRIQAVNERRRLAGDKPAELSAAKDLISGALKALSAGDRPE